MREYFLIRVKSKKSSFKILFDDSQAYGFTDNSNMKSKRNEKVLLPYQLVFPRILLDSGQNWLENQNEIKKVIWITPMISVNNYSMIDLLFDFCLFQSHAGYTWLAGRKFPGIQGLLSWSLVIIRNPNLVLI